MCRQDELAVQSLEARVTELESALVESEHRAAVADQQYQKMRHTLERLAALKQQQQQQQQ